MRCRRRRRPPVTSAGCCWCLSLLALLLPPPAAAQDAWLGANSSYAVETLPVLDPYGSVEQGVHFRARLIATDPVPALGDYSANDSWALRLVRSRSALSGEPYLCNDTALPPGVILSERMLPGGPRRSGDLTGGFVTFVVPSVGFRLCYIGPNSTGELWVVGNFSVAGDNSTDYVLGHEVNVTVPSIWWDIPAADYTPGSWAALRVSGTAPLLTAAAAPRDGDLLKLVPHGRLCIDDGEGLGGGLAGAVPQRIDWGAIWRFAPVGRTCAGTGLGTGRRITVPSNTSTIRRYELYCRLPLPDKTQRRFTVCYSPASDRASHLPGSPGWRFLPSLSSPVGEVEGTLTTGAARQHLTWQLNDTTRGSFAALRISSAQSDLRRLPQGAAPHFAISEAAGGDQVRLLSISAFAPGRSGCFHDEPLERGIGGDYAARNGPSEASSLHPSPSVVPFDVDMLLWGDPTPTQQQDAWAFLRVPLWESPLVVCYRMAGRNWFRVGPLMHLLDPEYNITWHVNDTTAGSYAPLAIIAPALVLSDAPPLAFGSVVVKLVLPKESCLTTPALPGTFVWDSGGPEILGRQSVDLTEAAINKTSVVAWIRMPAHASSAEAGPGAYRVCLQRGWLNWVEIPSYGAEPSPFDDEGWLLVPSPPTDMYFEVPDPRGGMWGTVLLVSPAQELDLRPAGYTAGVLTSGTLLRVVPNGTQCVPSHPDPHANHTSADLGFYCTRAADAGCASLPVRYRSRAGDQVNTRGGIAYLLLPTPPAGSADSYRVCVKVAGSNWIEPAPGQADIAPPPQMQQTPAAPPGSGRTAPLEFRVLSGPPLSEGDTVKLVDPGQNCFEPPTNDGRARSRRVEPVGDRRTATVYMPLPVSPVQRSYVICYLSEGYANWLQLPAQISVPPGVIEFSALHRTVERTRVQVAFYSADLFDTRPGRDAAWLLPLRHGAACEDGGLDPVAALGPVVAVGAVISIAQFALPPVEGGYGRTFVVCYQLAGAAPEEVGEAALPPTDVLPWPGPQPINLPGGVFLILHSGMGYAAVDLSPVSPPSNVAPRAAVAGAHVDAGVGMIRVAATAGELDTIADRFKFVAAGALGCDGPSATGTDTADSLLCDDTANSTSNTTCSAVFPNTIIPQEPGEYELCFLRAAVTTVWIAVGGEAGAISVHDSNLRWDFRGGQLIFSDTSFDPDTFAPSPTLSAAGDQAKVVPQGLLCGVGPEPPTSLSPAPFPTIPLLCAEGDATCEAGMERISTAALDTAQAIGGFRVCYRKGVAGPSAPAGVWVEVPSWGGDALSVGGATHLYWAGGLSPFSLWNATSLFPVSEFVDVTVEFRRADGTAARDAVGVITASLTVLNRARQAGVFENYAGECANERATTFAWPASGAKQWARGGRASFRIKIMADCGPGCRLTFSAPGVANVSDTFWSSPIQPAALLMEPPLPYRGTVNPRPIVSAPGEWYPVTVLGVDARGSAAVAALSSLRISPNVSELGRGALVCRNPTTLQSCGAAVSPGPFPASLNESGRATVELGITGRTTVVDGKVGVQVFLTADSAVSATFTLGVRAVRPAVLQLVAITAQHPLSRWISQPPRPWAAAGPLPGSGVRTAPGRYLLTQVQYEVAVRLADAQGRAGRLSDVSAYAPHNYLALEVVDESGAVVDTILDIAGTPLTGPAAANFDGVWRVLLQFSRPCGEYDPTAGIDRPCRLLPALVNASGGHTTPNPPGANLTDPVLIYIREQAERTVVLPPAPLQPAAPADVTVLAVGPSGMRDWWSYGTVQLLAAPTPRFDGRGRRWAGEEAALVTVASARLGEADALLPAAEMWYGAARFPVLTLSRPCSSCPVDAVSSEGLHMGPPADWQGVGTVAALHASVETPAGEALLGDGQGRLVGAVGRWVVLRITAVDAVNRSTHADSTTRLSIASVRGLIPARVVNGTLVNVSLSSPRYEVGGNLTGVQLTRGAAELRLLFADPCFDCRITFLVRPSELDWVNASALSTWESPLIDVRIAPEVRRLEAIVDPSMEQLTDVPGAAGDVWHIIPRGVPVTVSVRALDHWGELVEMTDTAAEITSGAELGALGGDGGNWGAGTNAISIENGWINFTGSIPEACLRCWVRYGVPGLSRFEVSLSVTAVPNTIRTDSPDGVPLEPPELLYPWVDFPGNRMPGAGEAWTVEAWVGELASGGRFVASWSRAVPCRVESATGRLAEMQRIDCSRGCTGAEQGGYAALTVSRAVSPQRQLLALRSGHYSELGGRVVPLISGRKPGLERPVVVQVIFEGDLFDTWQGPTSVSYTLKWAAEPPRRLVVLDAAHYSGPGWTVDADPAAAIAAANREVGRWSYAEQAALYAGGPFPVWLELHSAAGRPVPVGEGAVTVELEAEGCGDGAPLQWRQVRLPAYVGDGSATLPELLPWGSGVELREGRALVHLRFGSPCERCAARFTLTPPPGSAGVNVSAALRRARTREVRVLPMTPDALRWLDPAGNATGPPPVAHIQVGQPLSAGANLSVVAVRRSGGLLHRPPSVGTLLVSHHKDPALGGGGFGGANLTGATVPLAQGLGTVHSAFASACEPFCEVSVRATGTLARSVGGAPLTAPTRFRVTARPDTVVIYGTAARTVRTGESFEVVVAAVNRAGERASGAAPGGVRLWRVEGGGNGDGGRLEWTNAPYLTPAEFPLRETPSYDNAPVLEGTQWREGAQVWRLLLTESCGLCEVGFGTTAGDRVLRITAVSRATRLVVSQLSSNTVLLGAGVLRFRVAAADEAGNWDESFGTPQQRVPLNVSLVRPGGAPVNSTASFRSLQDGRLGVNSSAVGFVGGVAHVACVFSLPVERVWLAVEARGLTNLPPPTPGLPLLQSDPRNPPTITVRTVPYGLALLTARPLPDAIIGTPVRLDYAVVDSSPPPGPHVAVEGQGVVSLSAEDCGGVAPDISPAPLANLTAGRASFSVTFHGGHGTRCRVEAQLPEGALQRTRVVVRLEVRRAACTELRLAPGLQPWQVAGIPASAAVLCTDAAGSVDATAEGAVAVAGSCGMEALREVAMTAGVAPFSLTFQQDGANCSVSAAAVRLRAGPNATRAVPSIATAGGITVQRPVELRVISGPGSEVHVGRPFGLVAAAYDAAGAVVLGVGRPRVAVELEEGVRQPPPPITLLTPAEAPSSGPRHGLWSLWVAVGGVTPGRSVAQVAVYYANLRAASAPFTSHRAAAKLVKDGDAVPANLVIGRPFAVSVRATDAGGTYFPEVGDSPLRGGDVGADALVRLRMLDPVELRPLRDQSRLRNVLSPQRNLTLHLEEGRQRWHIQWGGADAQILVAVVSVPMSRLEMYGPMRLTLQRIATLMVISPPLHAKCPGLRSECGACIGCRPPDRFPFLADVLVKDLLNNTVLGDSTTEVTPLWETNEGWQKVIFTPAKQTVVEGEATFSVVYDSPSVNTTIGFRAVTGVTRNLTAWSSNFVVADSTLREPIPGVTPAPLPYQPPRLVLAVGTWTSRGSFSPGVFAESIGGALGNVTVQEVDVRAACDYNRSGMAPLYPLADHCDYYNVSANAARRALQQQGTQQQANATSSPTRAPVPSTAVMVEFALLKDEASVWAAVSALAAQVGDPTSALAAALGPLAPLQAIAAPGQALPPAAAPASAPADAPEERPPTTNLFSGAARPAAALSCAIWAAAALAAAP